MRVALPLPADQYGNEYPAGAWTITDVHLDYGRRTASWRVSGFRDAVALDSGAAAPVVGMDFSVGPDAVEEVVDGDGNVTAPRIPSFDELFGEAIVGAAFAGVWGYTLSRPELAGAEILP
jgi:hypothetical protein